MDIPFDFTMAASKNVGVVADPKALTTSGTNPYATRNIAASTARQMVLPCVITGLSIVGDVADAPMQIGTWDTVGSSFILLYTVEATQVEGGGIVVGFPAQGIPAALSQTVVLAVKNLTDDVAVRVVGHITVFTPAPTMTELNALLALANTDYLLDDNGAIILDEADLALEDD